MNLLDTIKQNRQALGAQQAPVTDETNTVQRLLRAKSGQAGGSDTAISNVGEQAAADQTNVGLDAARSQGAVQQQADQQTADAEQSKTASNVSSIDQARRFNTVQQRMQTNQVLNDLSQQRGDLDLQKDGARLEQVAFNLSMQDKQYTDKLQDIGRRRRLDDDSAFKLEMEKMAYGDTLSLVQQKIGNRDILALNDREYKKAMSDLSIEDAMKVAEMEAAANEKLAALDRQALSEGAESNAAAANIQSQSAAVSGLLNAGTKAASLYADRPGANDTEYQAYSDRGGTASYQDYKSNRVGG